jgi:hypothetical protein
MKKTKCDGEFPCKRCKDDGLICTIGTRKKVEYKQLPRGYAEVLEHSQLALIATIHKLYSMVRNQQPWDRDEPDLNERGQPVIHTIASKLGCIRPTTDLDLPVESVFPEDEPGLRELASQLEAQQRERDGAAAMTTGASSGGDTDSTCCNRTERASSSDLDHSDYEREAMAGMSPSVAPTPSPQMFTFDFDEASGLPTMTTTTQRRAPTTTNAAATNEADFMFAARSPTLANFPSPWQQQFSPQQQARALLGLDMLNQAVLDSTFAGLKPPDLVSATAMMGLGDPMIFTDGDWDANTL